MDRYNIGNTNYSAFMNDKTNQYNMLVRNAEIANRNSGGQPTKEEGNFYREAIDVCNEIINMNLSQRAVATSWTQRRKVCEAEVNRIFAALMPPPPPKAEKAVERGENREYNGARKPGSGKSAGGKESIAPYTTDDGIKINHACKEVPAETIEKWFKDAPAHSLEDVIGLDFQKEKLMKEVGNMGWVQTDEVLKITPVRGFFFYGPPGTGKTFLIEAFAHEMMKKGFKFIRLLGGDIHASLVGVAEKTIEIAFKEAIDNEPCIIFVDEVENVCVNRARFNSEGHERRLTTAFLEAYNLLKESGKRVIFMGATNFPSRVDEAMLDRITLIPIPLPDEAMRANHFQRKLKRLPLEDGLTYEELADLTDNYSFRDLDRLTESISITLRGIATEQYKVLNENGEVDQEATDKATSEAIREGKIKLTRELFESERKAIPPSNKTESRAELEAFEKKVKALM